MLKKTVKTPDAIRLLKDDHTAVDALFKRYESARSEQVKRGLVQDICRDLKVHTQIEEEIFYPAVRELLGDDDLLDEAAVEHQGAKVLIRELEQGDVGDALYDAKVTVLGEYVKHHVKEEQRELFPKARKAGADLKALGERLYTRKQELMMERREMPLKA